MRALARRFGGKRLVGGLEIEVAGDDARLAGGGDPFHPTLDIIILAVEARLGIGGEDRDAVGVVGQPRRPPRLVRGGPFAQHHDVAIFLMLEEVIDAFLFHQTRDEGEVAFLILHAVTARHARAGQAAVVDVLDAGALDHLLDDLDRGLILKDRHLAVLRQIIGPGLQGQAVMMPALRFLHIFAGGDQPVEPAQQLLILQHGERGGLAEMRLEIDLQRRDDVRMIGEGAPEPFAALDPF